MVVACASDPSGIGSGAGSHASQDPSIETFAAVAAPTTVYNFRVARYHDYFAGGVLVHNKMTNTSVYTPPAN